MADADESGFDDFFQTPSQENPMGRSILLWLLGIPIPIIILLALFWR